MNASLRLRLALLVVCSVALTVALVLYLTWQRVGETMIGMEEKNFATLLLVEEERLNTATLNHLAAKVRSVLLRKAQLRDTSARVQALLRALAPQHPAGSGQAHLVLQPLLSAMDAASIALVDDVDSIRMEILDTEKLRSGQTSLLGLSSSLRDAKQRPVQRLLKQLSRDGDFAVFDLPRLVATNEGRMVPSGTYRPVLTYFLPLDGHRPSREILVSMIPLDDLEKMAVRAQTQLLEDTREKFREMSLYPGGLVALLDGDGHILVSGGDGLLPDGLDAARAEARQTGMAKVILPSAQGDMLCLLGSIRAFGWYVALTAPLDEIQEPSDSLLASLLAVSLLLPLGLRLAGLPWPWALVFALALGLALLPCALWLSRKLGIPVYCCGICPLGMTANLLARLSPWRLRRNGHCTGCGACARVCRYGALRLDGDGRVTGPDWRCTLCRDCMSVCRHRALEIRCCGRGGAWVEQALLCSLSVLHTLFLFMGRV